MQQQYSSASTALAVDSVIHFGTSVECVIPAKYQSVDLAVVRPMAHLCLRDGGCRWHKTSFCALTSMPCTQYPKGTVLLCLDGILQSSTVDAVRKGRALVPLLLVPPRDRSTNGATCDNCQPCMHCILCSSMRRSHRLMPFRNSASFFGSTQGGVNAQGPCTKKA